MKTSFGTLMVVTLVGFGPTIVGCERKPQDTSRGSTAAAPGKAAALPPGLFVARAPARARAVAEVKADANAPSEVVVRGRIGGRREPFVGGAAVFLLADSRLTPCNELHGDNCPTPWDYCCEPRESLAAKTATIQVVGDDGKPLRVNLNGTQGLEPLAELTIAGEIVPRGDTGTLMINAKRIYVHPRGG